MTLSGKCLWYFPVTCKPTRLHTVHPPCCVYWCIQMAKVLCILQQYVCVLIPYSVSYIYYQLLLLIYIQCIYIHIPKQTVFIGYIALQLFCSYNLWPMHVMLFDTIKPAYFKLVLSEVRVQCPARLFSVAPWIRAFAVCCWDIFWIILTWLHFPLMCYRYTAVCCCCCCCCWSY
jgi:hypothetical protein